MRLVIIFFTLTIYSVWSQTLPPLEFEASNFICTNSSRTFVHLNSNSYSDVISRLWTIENDSITITSTDEHATVYFTIPGKYDVTLTLNTSNGTLSTTKTDYIFVGEIPILNCIPSSDNILDFWQTINNVKLNTLDAYSSPSINGGYSDLRCSNSTILRSGESYNLSLTLNSYNYDQYVEVYIDYNNNNEFTNNELVYSGSIDLNKNGGNTEILTSNITVPSNSVILNTPLLMRVEGYALAGTLSEGCSRIWNIGDIEDYIVIVKPCIGPNIDKVEHKLLCNTSGFYTLPAITGTNLTGSEAYYTLTGGPSGGGLVIPEGTVINSTSTIFIYDELGACSDEESFTVTINESPTANAGLATDVICQTDIYTLAATATNGTIAWTTSGTGAFNDATLEDPIYTTSAADILAGTVTLTMTVSNAPCVDAIDHIVLTINPAPTAYAGLATDDICEGTAYALAATATNGTIAWTTSGTGVFNDATLEDPIYTPSAADITAGTVTLTMTVSNLFCTDSTDNIVLVINQVPNPGTASITDATICQGSTTTASSTQAGGLWSSSDLGVATVDANTGLVTGIGAGTTTLTYTVSGTGFCLGIDGISTVNVTLVGLPSAYAGGANTICSGDDFTAAATATNGTIAWTTSGTGTFGDATIEDAVYKPSAADITAGSVTLTMTVSAGACGGSTVNDVMTLTINSADAPTATANTVPNQTICSIDNFTAAATATNGTIAWTTSGTGTFDDASLEDPTYTLSSGDINAGSVMLKMNVTNNIGCSVTDSIIINYGNQSNSIINISSLGEYTLNGITYQESGTYQQILQNIEGCDSIIELNLFVYSVGMEGLDKENLKIYPNPSETGVFILETNSKQINSFNVRNTEGSLIFSSHEPINKIDLSRFENGIYFLEVLVDDRIYVVMLLKNK